MATKLDNLALFCHDHGKYAEAEPLYQRALAIYEKALGSEHSHVAASLENYASLLRATGRVSEAAELEARAKATRAVGKRSALRARHCHLPTELSTICCVLPRYSGHILKREASSPTSMS